VFLDELVTPMSVAGILTILVGVAIAIVPGAKTRSAVARSATD